MQRLEIALTLIIATTAFAVTACSTPKPCAPVTINPNIDDNCPSGGSYCAASEGQHCSGTWPFRKYCTTVYLAGGTCACRCQ